MANRILASSLDNFVVFNTPTVALPYVTFTVGTLSSNVEIEIKEANNDYGYSRVINGSPNGETTSTSFNTTGLGLFNLYECIKLNSIFYNITFLNSNTMKCFIDASLKYDIALTDGSGITIGGTYSSYSPSLPNKTCVILQSSGDTNSINMEKYHNAATVSFNVTAPFQKTMFFKPLEYSVAGYKVSNGSASNITIPFETMTVMPTTLTKFQKVNYDDYLWKQGQNSCKFLTTQEHRYYNYDEWVGLSVLSDTIFSTPMLRKSYYTNSGVFLKTEWSVQYVEKNGRRYDLYDVFNLNSIEAQFNKQVGYIMVSFTTGFGFPAFSNEIKFEINPKCDGNNEVFFLNEIGGVDSFNFTNTKEVKRGISNQNTYAKTHTRGFIDIFDHEYVMSKRNKITTTLSTNQLDISIANWLNQLVKSKYTYKFLGMNNPMFKIIVVDKFDIQTNTADDEFELTLEYHDADNDSVI